MTATAPQFPTVDVSPVTADGLRFVTVFSPALRRRVDLTVWVPPGATSPLPLVTLLHGVYGSHWGWAWNGRAHEAAAGLIASGAMPPVALAMPSDGLWSHGSGYVTHGDADYEAWIVHEVPAAVRAAGVLVDDGPGALIGLSMGGFGAVRLAMRHPERYAATVGLSAICRWSSMRTFVGDLGRYPDVDDPDLAPLVTGCPDRPALRLDCGSEDLLIDENRELHDLLVAAGVGHEYEEHPGGHEWPYWADRVGPALAFAGRHLSAGR